MTETKEIKKMMQDKGIKQWQVADEIGISEFHFSRLLRKPVSDELADKIIKAIERLSKGE